MKLNFNRKQKRGFTLIELLLVVGFIAVAGIGIYTVYNNVTLNNAANTENRNIDTIRAGVKNLFAGAPTTAGLTNTVVNNAAITPKNMITTGSPTVITNSFGGAVTVTPIALIVANDGFRITYPAVPGAVCTKLVTGTGSQFEHVIVGTTTVKALGTNTSINIAATTTACAGDTGTGVTILFDSLK